MISYHKHKLRPYDMHISLDITPKNYNRAGRKINFFDSHNNVHKLTLDHSVKYQLMTPTDIVETEERSLGKSSMDKSQSIRISNQGHQ